MKGYRRATAVRVAKLPVRTTLPDLHEAELPEKRHDFARLQDWQPAHGSSHFDSLGADKHAFQLRVTFF